MYRLIGIIEERKTFLGYRVFDELFLDNYMDITVDKLISMLRKGVEFSNVCLIGDKLFCTDCTKEDLPLIDIYEKEMCPRFEIFKLDLRASTKVYSVVYCNGIVHEIDEFMLEEAIKNGLVVNMIFCAFGETSILKRVEMDLLFDFNVV